MIFTEGIGI